MKAFTWLLRLLFFVVVLWFAMKNRATVPVQLTESLRWENVPLIFIMIACIAIGVIAGAVSMAPKVFRLRRQLVQAQARVQSASPARPAPASIRRGPATISERMANVARNAGAVGQLDADTRADTRLGE
jgi:uncharacterized integral membrane protein